MSITISAEQREALSSHLERELPGLIEGLWGMIGRGEIYAANQRALELSDALRLVAEDLGWGETGGDPIELTSPPDVLKRSFTRPLNGAAKLYDTQGGAWEEARQQEREVRTVQEACDAVLAKLGETQRDGEPQVS